ncbi:MAG: hypothetical protein QGG40_00540 [Myxococcota bacterium]|nr:hypothetical protein [Myxococcota bacterium]
MLVGTAVLLWGCSQNEPVVMIESSPVPGWFVPPTLQTVIKMDVQGAVDTCYRAHLDQGGSEQGAVTLQGRLVGDQLIIEKQGSAPDPLVRCARQGFELPGLVAKLPTTEGDWGFSVTLDFTH